MDHKTPRNTAVPQNRAQDQKRAGAKVPECISATERGAALRQNLLKRKQQTRARDGSAVKLNNSSAVKSNNGSAVKSNNPKEK